MDTANLAAIEKYIKIYRIAGVTTNPTIVSREKTDFIPLVKAIRALVGEKQLHVQVTATAHDDILREAAEEDLRFWLKRGFNFVAAGDDIASLFLAYKAQYATMRKVFGKAKED